MSRSDGVTTSARFWPIAAAKVELLDDPVEELLDDDRRHVKEAVDEAAAHDEEDEVPKPVPMYVVILVTGALADHVIAEPDRGEGHKAK